MADFDANLAFRTGLLNSTTGNASGGDGIANQLETPEIILKGLDKSAGTVSKFVGSWLPIPVNFGEVSMAAGLEVAQGAAWSEKKPLEGAGLSMRGGALYNILVALIKDGSIKDHFTHPGGGDSSHFLDSSGFAQASMDFSHHALEPMDYGGSGNFGATGQLAPPDLPIISSGRGESHSME
jgi:hypothetical protein